MAEYEYEYETPEGYVQAEYIDPETAREQVRRHSKKAGKLIDDPDALERFLQKLERKLADIPTAGTELAKIPVLVSLLRSYIKKEYTEVPRATLIAIVAALVYVMLPIDLIPDFIPVLGIIDDAAVVAACWMMTGADVQRYRAWREKNGWALN